MDSEEVTFRGVVGRRSQRYGGLLRSLGLDLTEGRRTVGGKPSQTNRADNTNRLDPLLMIKTNKCGGEKKFKKDTINYRNV